MQKSPEPASFYVAGCSPIEDSVGFLMRRAIQSIVQVADRRFADHDLTYAQWMPLYKLHLGQNMTVASLARDLQLDPGATTRVLDRLEGKGLVRRVRSEEDRRVVKLALTDEGWRVAEAVPPVLASVLNAHLAGFSHDEWRTLIGLLRRMIENGEAIRETELRDVRETEASR